MHIGRQRKGTEIFGFYDVDTERKVVAGGADCESVPPPGFDMKIIGELFFFDWLFSIGLEP